MDIIYYGVGKNLKDYEHKFVEQTGIPACLCDRDIDKQNTDYVFSNGEQKRIYSLEYIKNNYEDFELWITLAEHNLSCVVDDLTQNGVSQDKIHFFGNLEYRLGCQNMNYYCYVQSFDSRACAHFPYMKSFHYDHEILSEDDVKKSLSELDAWRLDTIKKIKNGEKTSCDGCSALQWGFYTKTPEIKIFAVGPNFNGGTKCNCNCFYCNQNQVIREKSNQELSNYDIHRIAAGIYDSIENIILADGEPSLLPHLDELCDLINEKNWSVNFNTNAILYSEKLAKTLARNKQSFVAIALDSGSSETYKKIKRVDKFDLVINNIKKYKENGCRIFLKYILIPEINDNVEEIGRFIEIVKEIGIEHVTLSQNMSGFVDGVGHQLDPNMSESMFALFSYFIARLQEEHIEWDFQIEFISQHDFERIEKLRR